MLYLQNTTTGVGAPTFNTVQYNYEGIDVGNESSPHLADLDRDGDLDLIIGNYAGKTFYFENTETSTTPSFSNTATLQNIGGYDMSVGYGRNINPFFVDIDSAWHCFLGQQNGDISHLGNIDEVTGIYDTYPPNLLNYTWEGILILPLEILIMMDYLTMCLEIYVVVKHL